MKLTGKITHGKRVYDNPAALVIALADIGEGKRFTETIEREQDRRSKAQNDRYHAVLKPLAKECLRRTQGLILSDDQVHDMLCRAFIGVVDTPFGPVRKESKVLSVAEFLEFTRQVELWIREAWLGDDVELMEMDA